MSYARNWCEVMTDGAETNLVEAGYDAVHTAMPESPTLLRIWREHATGEDFPEEFWHISFLTLKEAERILGDLQLAAGSSLADLGCGTGGPGLLLAHETGARLTGVDLSAAAVRIGTERAAKLELADRARFQKGSFAETGLADYVADAAVSFDAIMYAPDKRAAFAEAARILRPSSRFAFTAFEHDPEAVAGMPVVGADPAEDFRPWLEAAGLTTLVYEETPGWKKRLYGAYQAVADAQDALREEMGPPAVAAFMWEVTAELERHIYKRRVYCLAQAPARSIH